MTFEVAGDFLYVRLLSLPVEPISFAFFFIATILSVAFFALSTGRASRYRLLHDDLLVYVAIMFTSYCLLAVSMYQLYHRPSIFGMFLDFLPHLVFEVGEFFIEGLIELKIGHGAFAESRSGEHDRC